MDVRKGFEFDSIGPFEKAAWEIADKATVLLEAKFGRAGTDPKEYHSPDHTNGLNGVINVALKLACEAGEEITDKDRALIIIAAAWHDVIQDQEGAGVNEAWSAKLACDEMRKYLPSTEGFPDFFTQDDQAKVTRMIMGTQMEQVVENGQTIRRQAATEDDPLLVRILADADLCTLGAVTTEVYWPDAINLFNEIYGENATNEQRVKFMEGQVSLLKSHQFLTSMAQKQYPHKDENIAYAEAMLEFALAA